MSGATQPEGNATPPAQAEPATQTTAPTPRTSEAATAVPPDGEPRTGPTPSDPAPQNEGL